MRSERNGVEIRVWLLRNKPRVSLRSISRDLGVSNTLVSNCISSRNDNRKVLRRLLELGVPAELLDLPEDMRGAA